MLILQTGNHQAGVMIMPKTILVTTNQFALSSFETMENENARQALTTQTYGMEATNLH
jgi:hypothetical protein